MIYDHQEPMRLTCALHQDVTAHMRARHQAIEEACEASLTDPRGWGVLVVDHPLDEAMRPSVSVGLNPNVPYGYIHYRDERSAQW